MRAIRIENDQGTAAHSEIWDNVRRYEALRASISLLRESLGTSASVLRNRMRLVLGDDVPSGRNLNRFVRGDKGVFKHRPEFLSGLCLAGYNYALDKEEELGEHETVLADLKELYDTIRERDPQFPKSCRIRVGNRNRTDGQHEYTQEQLQDIIGSIVVPIGGDDPYKPEYPPNSPRFPATPMEVYEIRGHRVHIKNESWNNTGSHKDRWAWEQLIQYKKEIQSTLEQSEPKRAIQIPHLSMISSGSAAFALQTLLRDLGLPPLRVLMDRERTKPQIVRKLKVIGAKLYFRDLDTQEFDEDRVLQITNNHHGIDITTRNMLAPERQNFYDWLVCEILLYEPTHIFVPFGTGDLFTNIILFLEKANASKVRDKRLVAVDDRKLKGINVYGATTTDPKTIMDKLYAAFRPTLADVERKLTELKASSVLGTNSAVIPISDSCALEALNFANSKMIRTEISGIAGLGLFMSKHNSLSIGADDTVVVVNTGLMYLPGQT